MAEDYSQIDISKEEKDKLVSEVVRYVLFKTLQNSDCPIKREELTQLVTKNYRQRALPALVIKEAQGKLSSIFGYEMKELQRSLPSSANQNQNRASQQCVTDAKVYVVRSKLSSEEYTKFVANEETCVIAGFTIVVLGIVHAAGGKIQEEHLWHHMKRLGLQETDENHPALGNTKQALESLLQQRYLQKVKVNGPEGITLFYELAERALDEPVYQRLKQYVSQIVNKDAANMEIGED